MHPSSSPCSAPPPTSIHSALHVYQSGCRAQEKPFRGQESHLYEYTPPNPPYLPLKMEFHIWFKKYPSPINKCVNHNPSASFDLWYPSRTVQLWQKSPEFSLSSQLKNPFMTKTAAPLKVLCLQTFVHYTLFLKETKLRKGGQRKHRLAECVRSN